MGTMAALETKEFLEGFDHESNPHAAEYLNTHLCRLLATLDLMPGLETGARILELGAFPYFMTSLLLRNFPHCHLELANGPDRLKQDGGRPWKTGRSKRNCAWTNHGCRETLPLARILATLVLPSNECGWSSPRPRPRPYPHLRPHRLAERQEGDGGNESMSVKERPSPR